MDENKKVTVSFGGYDDTNDNTIMLHAPVAVNKSVQTINDLYTIDLSKYAEGSSIIVFVKNVDKSAAQIGEIPYRGAFYRYNWETNGWESIVIGTHSHSNMQLLDQLGEINTSTLKEGDKRYLTIEKISTPDDALVQQPDYKLSFTEHKELPDIPADVSGKNLYLTADNSGNYHWNNNFAPAQTFKVFQIKVDTSNRISSKELLIPSDYLTNNSILFDEELNDTVLVFDTGSLVPDVVSSKTEAGLSIVVNNTIESQTFDLDETLIIMIVRDGISGIIDTFEKQYLTKQDAVELLSNGTINLKGYVTKDALSRYSLNEHTHPEYVKKTDYNIFDWRYADYQHAHPEYMTKAQVFAILSYAAENDTDSNGNVDSTKTLTDAIESFENEFNDKLSSYITTTQVSNIVDNLKTSLSNSDNIVVPYKSKTLSEVLHIIDNKLSTSNTTDADNVLLNNIKINIGNGNTIGGLSNGDEFKKGTSLSALLQRLFTKEDKPNLVEPELKVKYLIENNNAGVQTDINITPEFIQNDGGKLNKITIKIYKKDEISENDEPWFESEIDNNETFVTNQFMNAYNDKGHCYNIVITAFYSAGNVKTSNIGLSYSIPSGSVSYSFIVSNERKPILGYLHDSYEPISGRDIYDAEHNSSCSTINPRSLSEKDLFTGIELYFDKNAKAKTFVFAIPETYKYKLSKIMYMNQYFDITDDFKTTNITIPDESGNIDNYIDNSYKVYTYSLKQFNKATMIFKLLFIRKEN